MELCFAVTINALGCREVIGINIAPSEAKNILDRLPASADMKGPSPCPARRFRCPEVAHCERTSIGAGSVGFG